MAGNQEDKLDFGSSGAAWGYISLDQARVLALQHARDNRELYGRYAEQELAWDVISADETDEPRWHQPGQYNESSGQGGNPGGSHKHSPWACPRCS